MASILGIKITRLFKSQTTSTILMICLALLFSLSFLGLLVDVEAQATSTNKVSCAAKSTTNQNHLYKAEWTMLPAVVGSVQILPSFDFFQCIWDTTRQVWLLYSFNCTGSRQGATNPTTTEKYCNFFDESAQKCILDKPAAKCLPG